MQEYYVNYEGKHFTKIVDDPTLKGKKLCKGVIQKYIGDKNQFQVFYPELEKPDYLSANYIDKVCHVT
jgi:hypothetical protein